ncbi:unnamed protein product [Linum trigynum]|uniref:Uncharacterized protein n=1 Tax=Linum trigynum TaxID=586398 RepID=A0AAV2F4F0_9ROSI
MRKNQAPATTVDLVFPLWREGVPDPEANGLSSRDLVVRLVPVEESGNFGFDDIDLERLVVFHSREVPDGYERRRAVFFH